MVKHHFGSTAVVSRGVAHDTTIVYFIYSVSDDRLKAFSVDRDRVVSEVAVTVQGS